MPHAERAEIIRELERQRDSRVLCYVTGDRSPVAAKIGDDAVRPLMALLRQMGRVPNLDLFLYTRGGSSDVPWRIVRQLRRHATERWRVLVPYRANSAGTLIALGADEIVFCGEGELGPIDPSMQVQRLGQDGTPVGDSISVEDVMAYVRFVRERGGLTDQSALVSALAKLIDRVDPVALGNVYRTHTHIRDVARRILGSRNEVPPAETQDQIVRTLSEQVYAHGHAIGVEVAEEMGLTVSEATGEVDRMMWSLLEAYEEDLQLRSPVDPVHALGASDSYSEDVVIAVLETADGCHEFGGQLEVKGKRNVPQQLQVNLSLNLQMPAGLNAQGLPPNVQAFVQQVVQQAQQAALQQAQTAVQQALNAQAPLLGADFRLRGGQWRRAL